MIRNEISKFMALAPLIMPKLIKDCKTEPEITEDYAILYFSFGERLPIGLVMDMCDTEMELLMLHHATSRDNPQIQHCCFFPMPKTGCCKFKINIETDEHGFADGLKVTIFDADATDVWEQSLESDISIHSHGFDFTQAIKESEVLSLFMKLD